MQVDVKFDHDFISRDALKALDPSAERRKVTLGWNAEDLAKVMASPVGNAPGLLFFDFPNFNYGASNFDGVLDADGSLAGLSMFAGYAANERKGLSLATVDPGVPTGAEVRLIWGEPDGGSKKSTIEPHEQTESGQSSAPPRTRQSYATSTAPVGGPATRDSRLKEGSA